MALFENLMLYVLIRSAAKEILNMENINIKNGNINPIEPSIQIKNISAYLSCWGLTELIVGTISAILCIYGIYKIWNLHKNGFYYYLVGQIISILCLSIFFLYSISLDIEEVTGLKIATEGIYASAVLYTLLYPGIGLLFILH